ncbi:hypothetical protein [Streptomyces sp. ML-6]|uniref:hypothetical protein n=1 Tax=Streptomyces sp. ML-6 TaxID=2982693 RepID=UPI0024BF6185|nr:hypothetical protein [Streptomyces sp. ML-6]MDK0523426.1 hypothetical protein [Streptomyces sp. ML-6]
MTAGEPVALGLPGPPARPLAVRRPSRRIRVGSVAVGIEEALKIAEGMDGTGTPSGAPTVTAS